LVVDDEASILTITSQTLQAFGYRVLTATDGADAVAVYAQHKNEIAVVLTDMMMPVMDGPATIRALMRINPAIKIIAASGLNANGAWPKSSGPASNTS
jgi:CheY-like chemotaxis protein